MSTFLERLGVSRITRARIRMASLLENGGASTKFFLIILPIVKDLVWVGLYFAERQADVFLSYGPCDTLHPYSNSSSPTPFFVTRRSYSFWIVQCLFAVLTTFYTMPLKVVKIDPRRNIFATFALAFVDVVVLMPFLLSMNFLPAMYAYVPSFLRIWSATDNVNAFFDQQDARDMIVRLFGYTTSVAVTMIAVFEWTENNWPSDPVYGEVFSTSYPCTTFLESLYWFVVSFATVGYGDVVPNNQVSRVAVIICIVVFLLLLPLFVNTVFAILDLLRDYTRISHSIDGPFVIVDGHIRARTALQALITVQPREKFDLYQHMIFMSPREVSTGLQDVQRRTDSFCRAVLLRGTIASAKDAERACLSRSSSVFILPNLDQDTEGGSSQTRNSALEEAIEAAEISLGEMRKDIDAMRETCLERDWDVVGRAWAARAAMQESRRVVLFHQANVDLVCRPRITKTCARCSDTFVLSMDRMEQLIGACSVTLPGFNAMLINMLISGLHFARSRTILVRYEDDMAKQYCRDLLEIELFAFELPDHFQPVPMTKLVALAAELNTCVIAKYAKEHYCTGAKRMHAESFDFSRSGLFRPGDSIICIGRDVEVFSTLAFDAMASSLSTASADPQPFAEGSDAVVAGELNELIAKGQTLGRAPPLHRFFRSPTSAGLSFSLPSHNLASAGTGSASSLAAANPSTAREHSGNTASKSIRHEVLNVPAVEPLSHVLLVERSQMQACRIDDARTDRHVLSVLDELMGLTNHVQMRELHDHIIVSADDVAHASLVSFVKHMRRSGLIEPIRPILILRPVPPGPSEWNDLSIFPEVYWQIGRPYVLHDLARAGLAQAHTLLVLTDAHLSYAGKGHDSVTMDRDKLLAMRVASSMRREFNLKFNVIVHMACEANLLITGPGAILSKQPSGYFIGIPGSARAMEHQMRADVNKLVRQVESIWKPALSAAVVEGSMWAPSALLLELWGLHGKGSWIEGFVEALMMQVGVHGGINIVAIEEGEDTFAKASARLTAQNMTVLGVWSGFDSTPVVDWSPDIDQEDPGFRGILLVPWGEFKLKREDRLVVCG